MSVGFHAINRGNVSDIDTVMVIGCGMIGMGAIVRASMRGATVIAVDIDDEKLQLARTFGAKHVINSRTEDLHSLLADITGGMGPTKVVEAVGSSLTQHEAIEEVAFTGTVVFIGYAPSETSFLTKLFVQKELDIRGSRNAKPADFRAVIHYLQQTTCPVEKLISRTVKPEKAATALQEWDSSPGKVFRILVEF
jgi:threonine dehydrogenase-like Zn-dependent dehydrogenase